LADLISDSHLIDIDFLRQDATPGGETAQVIGQVATWFDLAAQQPVIRKIYGMIFAAGDSANRVRPGRRDESARSG
jgi:hypothetical protein